MANIRKILQYVVSALFFIAFVFVFPSNVTTPGSPFNYLLRASNPNVQFDGGYPVVLFGTLGYCVQLYNNNGTSGGPTKCVGPQIGYDVTGLYYGDELFSLDVKIRPGAGGSTHIMTAFMILYPVVTVLCFINLLLSLRASFIRSSRPASYCCTLFVGVINCAITIIAVVMGFCWMELVRTFHVQHSLNNRPGVATYGIAMAILPISLASLVIANVLAIYLSCTSRKVSQPVRNDGYTPANMEHIYADQNKFQPDDLPPHYSSTSSASFVSYEKEIPL